ncbi:proline-rich receptor-like protein kinase PERK12 [Iris pallida]|uniref:Proline-rich receptor-like protein kinase PERK12 n=1 Tax=Iris pallida TaxID=29817 RepID=A0AAX6H9G6_IRIPA|nr:proline-rich receptor-like protein kinase PERK12 [Iris pallida]
MQKPQQQKQSQQQPHHLLPKLSFPPHNPTTTSVQSAPGRGLAVGLPSSASSTSFLFIFNINTTISMQSHHHLHLHAKPITTPLSWPEPRQPPAFSSNTPARRPPTAAPYYPSATSITTSISMQSRSPPPSHGLSPDNRRPPPPTPPHVGPQLPHVATPRVVAQPRAPPCTRCRQQQCNSAAAVRGRARVQAPPPAPPPSWPAGKTPHAGRTLRRLPLAANVLRDAPSRRFLRFERDPVDAREF